MTTTIPATTWSPASGQGETSTSVADNIVDSSSNNVADSSSNLLATSDSTPTSLPATTWSVNDGS